MKRRPFSLKILSTVFLLLGLSPCVWSSGYNNYKVGDDWKDGTISDRGFSDSASMIGSGFAPEMKLDDVRDLRKYFLKGYLEITPENYEGLLQYSDMYESAFKAYDRGVSVKRWKTSLDTEKLSDLLLAFTNIRQFKVEMIWDRENVDISETLSRSVQFFGNLGELTISRCQLTDGGLEDILESLKSPETLKILDIRENRLSNSILPKIRERLIRLIDLKTDLVQAESKSLSVKESDSDRIAEELRTERLKREAAEKRTAEVEEQRLEEAKRYADERKQQESQERAKKLEKPAPTSVIERPIQKGPSIPAIARGYEEIYERFLRGVLIYKPNKDNDIGRIDLPIASLLNPLESMFDLSRCGNAGQYLSISTGYRKGKVAANSSKYEVWIAPKFVVASEVGRTASHYRDIMSTWSAPFGLFYTYGGWDKLEWYDYLVTSSPEEISSKNLYENWGGAATPPFHNPRCARARTHFPPASDFIFNFN
jgi:hypothetical protein